jgi:hypothetical protein
MPGAYRARIFSIAQDVLRLVVIFEQFVEQFASDGHVLLLVFMLSIVQVLAIYTNSYTVSRLRGRKTV